MEENLQRQIELLQKENAKLSRQVTRLQVTLDRNKAVAASLSNIDSMQEMEYQKQRQYLQLLLENSPDIIILLDRDGRFAHCTNAFLKIARIPHFSFVSGMLFSEVFGAFANHAWGRKFSAQLRAAMQENNPLVFEDTINLSGDTPRTYMVHFTPIRGTDGITDSSLMMLHDITDIRAAQENAEAAREAAERASLAKSEFLANMSHEIRTPLNAVIGMTAIAKPSTSLEKKDYCLQKIEDASKHLLGIINDILDMSKIEANKLEISNAPFDLEKMFQKVVNVVNFRVEEKKLEFLVRIDPNISNILNGDEQRLAQTIANLLSNAVKFTPEYGFVSLDASLVWQKSGFCAIRIEVSDSGIGISEEQQEKLFTSFQQADSSTSRKFGGTGLGLAISKRLVEMMGGSILVRSEPNKGASFTFTVPLECCDETPAPLLAVPAEGVRIAAVSRSQSQLEYLRDILHKFGLNCDLFQGDQDINGQIEQQDPYDLGLIDWRTMASYGMDPIRALREKGRIRHIALMASALEWNTIGDEAGHAGITAFLLKPFFSSNVLNCLNECLQKEKETPQNDEQHEQERDLKGYRILLAEDVDINREIVLAFLEPSGLEIDCAENGAEALQLFSAAPDHYDMIFMDIQMPEMDGYEATRRIRALDAPSAATIPIVAMTANVFREDVERCMAAGMNDHVGKPLDFAVVLEKLDAYLPTRA